MTGSLGSSILDTIRDSLRLHVGFYRWRSDHGDLLWVVSARDNDGQRWVAKHEDFYSATVALAELVGFELEEG